ncbi:MAG: hypothetical protein A2X84_05765 [Desulfuromonadaceae bacterium GWC2_58_13]|nr:MAG: hypothetical protein A2X84_05765 [Desulfuromonadaceae bacterium GWC2_58_13]
MEKTTQAYVAHFAGRLLADWKGTSILDKNRGEKIDLKGQPANFTVMDHPAVQNCPAQRSRDGMNVCLVDRGTDHHICLSLYGKLFDGFDHGSESHFSGIVDEQIVSLYDFNESDYFIYEHQEH